MTIPPDMTPITEELRAEVHRLVHPFVHSARIECGRIPGVGTPQWWTASTAARIAGLLTLSEAWLAFDPQRELDLRFKAMSVDLCRAHDWSAASRRPSHAELAARRTEPGQLARSFDPDAAARWVETDSSSEPAA